MTRILILLITLTAGSHVGAQTDAEKFFREGAERNMQILAKEKDPKQRADAAEFLGGSKYPDAIMALAAALSDPDPRVRAAAANGLWKSEKMAEPARAQLRKALDDVSPEVAVRAAGALQSLGVDQAELVAARQRAFDAPGMPPNVRFLAARGLIGFAPPLSLIQPMLTYLSVSATTRPGTSPSDNARRNIELCEQALARLVATGDRALIAPLLSEVRRARSGQVVLIRTLALFNPKPDGWTQLLLGFLEPGEQKLRYETLVLLAKVENENDIAAWVPQVAVLLRDPDASIRSQAMWALGNAGGLAAGHVDAVVLSLDDSETSVRKYAARAIGEMAGANKAVAAATKSSVVSKARSALVAVMEKDADADVRREAKDALRKLGADATVASASAAPRDSNLEAGGLALLRARKITFEENSFLRALTETDLPVIVAFLDAGMSASASVAGLGSPIRAALFTGNGCAVNERPTNPQTKAMVKLLLERGADPNVADDYGNTALMAAASKGCDRELMKMLLRAGAKVGATNKGGVSAFDSGLYFANDGLEELIIAGYRLPPEKIKVYEQGYAGKPAALALIRKATKR